MTPSRVKPGTTASGHDHLLGAASDPSANEFNSPCAVPQDFFLDQMFLVCSTPCFHPSNDFRGSNERKTLCLFRGRIAAGVFSTVMPEAVLGDVHSRQ
jgi:hypothetical protein